MPTKQYCVTLEDTARDQLQRLLRTGNRSAREVARARILLKADAGETAATIAAAVEVAASTVERLRRRYCEEGLEAALGERPRPGNSRKLTGPQEAHLVAVACTPAPVGHTHWTLRLLAGKLVELGSAESIAPETVRQVLKKAPSNRGKWKRGAFRR